jgi:hypothetical protein
MEAAVKDAIIDVKSRGTEIRFVAAQVFQGETIGSKDATAIAVTKR